MLVVPSCFLAGLGFVYRRRLALATMIGVGAFNGFFNIILTTYVPSFPGSGRGVTAS